VTRKLQNILVTGGAGFIGSNFVHLLANKSDFIGRIINLDKLTYAGNLENLKGLPIDFERSRYHFIQGDICDEALIEKVLEEFEIDTIVHMAAESHVDRSIVSPLEFIQTNIVGTYNLLQCARKNWGDRTDVLFHHVSTDEVYGALGEEGQFTEDTKYDPRSPYSASKASSDHFVRAFHHTYGLPITISNCSNNYGPRQHPEKLIPLMITNMLKEKPLPVYGEGKNIRDWIYVDDHNEALWLIVNNGTVGETYNIGSNNEIRNIDLVKNLCSLLSEKKSEPVEKYTSLITYVTDRLGHDYRYSIDSHKIENDLKWKPKHSLSSGLAQTLRWYFQSN
jgi:dTDP-glucose 4,6-dehydratase